ncbi:MAG: muramoyltetrapeptide carboxypeptidase [Actinomycetota bacterium]|jgi:muramoyltetrapeptide carboxypeptidase|nr:muramoyltetrapeptide carboxypeptidase [Actinomycetota bacterium]
MTLKAPALQAGGTIGVPAPATPYTNRSDVLRGVEWWESRGYRVKLADGVYERDGYVAGDPKQRGHDINALFADPEVDVVQCLQGGYGSAQAIPYIDFDVIRDSPKPFVGFSDITALHTAIKHYTGLVTFYGPGLAGVDDPDKSPDERQFTQDRLLKALTASDPLGEMPRKPGDGYIRALNPGKASGQIAGGCLWLLGQAIGTEWQIDLDGKIFFFEDVDAPPWYIDGILNQMTQAGMLKNVVGVVVGELERCDWSEARPEFPQSLSIEDVLERYIQPLGVPAIYGLPLGHGKNMATLPLGVDVTVDADARQLVIDELATA